ncbi:MAG: nucleotidyltransferase domain-containing protein [Chloroflexota bacterium]
MRERLAEAVRAIADRRPEVEEVVLFGSLARGDATPGSDADLLVVLSSSDVSFLHRIPRYLPADCGIGVDVFPYTRDELASRLATSPRWAREVAEGIVLYQREANGGPESPETA